ncbi:hypothetical protein GCM10007049_33410 [Echinicola pacifica]|uniref:Uncharacterized protein n=1 Tax=Echinicola pacifica TaxID=346377 RepID=A0A918UVN7_9BACT|nr:hypothetical protein [Echinicola pacifica]GGZ37516.1 hypothetical protein GCM10007049_33410 [Echinicola pacifica]
MKRFQEIIRYIYNENLDQRFTEKKYYVNDQEIDIIIYDTIIKEDQRRSLDFVVVSESRYEHVFDNKVYIVKNQFDRKYFSIGKQKVFTHMDL